ncbi:PDR/VanB family oxidoreductase [Variovorax sp. LT1R16]|uniref:PDR/VanB family oxidoreductase n=1 Tax=Variovorax sp. LT1R16 TaxID=3443728 RepID=UPI003F490FE7
MLPTIANDLPLVLRVHSVRDETPGVKSVVLVSAGGEPLPTFTAGSHLELMFAAPDLPMGLRRHYSLLNDPTETDRYVIGVGLHPQSRGGSRYVHEALGVGAAVLSSLPRNHFSLCEHAPMSVLIAGGIGVTPLLAMARRLSRLGLRWRLYYCVRTPARAAFLDQLLSLPGGEVVTVFNGCAGVTPLNLEEVVRQAERDDHLYCCGPAPMMAAFEAAGRLRDPATLHVEWFEAPPISAGADTVTSGELIVHLAKAGISLRVPPDRSILSAVEAAGIEVPNSCGDGICGTCETRVLRGRPLHLDHVLTASEREKGDRMMVCVSRCLDPELTLDL